MDSATLRGGKMRLEIEIKLNYEKNQDTFFFFFFGPFRFAEIHTCSTCFLHDSDIGKMKSVLAGKI